MEGLKSKLDRMFNAKVVAVVGAKKENDYNWLRAYEHFQGKVYHVNLDRNEWPGAEELGFTNVASLTDIPEEVDHVVVSVPNVVVPAVLKDCIAKGVVGVHLFTAGFGESHTEIGERLENTIIEMASEADLPLIGPNCMGLYHPKAGMRMTRDQLYGENGVFAFISQSGTTSMSLSNIAPAHGLKVSKGVSFGNGISVDCTDLLEYLADDEDTEFIGMYLEGVRDGRRFFEALRSASQKKPVLVWKVGQSEEGSKAGQSHTGSKPISEAMWSAVLRQCGAVKVENTQEMIDTAIILQKMSIVGERVALLTVGGGHAGKIADVFGQKGFVIPSPSPISLTEISGYSSTTGGSFHNPFEGSSVREGESLTKTMDVLGRDPNFDLIVMEITAGGIDRDSEFPGKRIELVKNFMEQHKKPVLVLITDDVPYVEAVDTKPVERRFLESGIACINGMEQAAKVLRYALDYHKQRAWLDGSDDSTSA